MEGASTSSTGEDGGTMEIKIKTLDSQVYTCRVDPNISVPALKEYVATLTGVPLENQRLICRGKVLKDNHNLSNYNVEDGHTLHLVTRQAPAPVATSLSNGNNANEEEQDQSAAEARNRPTQVSHGVVMGTFNVQDNGDGGLADVNRIISSVLTSFGLANNVPSNVGGATNVTLNLPNVAAQVGNDSVRPQSLADIGHQPPAPRMYPGFFPAAVTTLPSMGQQFRISQQVIPDALTTISQYLGGLEQELAINGQHTDPGVSSANSTVRGQPTPANLGALIRRTMGLISHQATVELNRLSSELENEPNLVDADVRAELQSLALRDGVLFQYLGALLLELGRATLTLTMGTSPAEAAVNAGPAVFISSAGPNPMMVQPQPFQPGAGFGTVNLGSQQATGAMGSGEVPHNISIHIDANNAGIPPIPSQVAPSVQSIGPNNLSSETSPAVTTTGLNGGLSSSVARNNASSIHAIAVPVQSSRASAPEQPGVRVVPVRTVVTTMQSTLGRAGNDVNPTSSGFLHPLLARFQQLNSHNVNGTPAITSQTIPPSMGPMSQQPLNPSAPTIRAQVQVQARVPDGQGGTRVLSNEEALRAMFTLVPSASSSSPQYPQENVSQPEPSEQRQEVTTDIGPDRHVETEQATTVENMDSEHVDDAERNLSSHVHKEKEEVKDEKSEPSEAENMKNEPQETSATDVPAGLGLKGLQPLPLRSSRKLARSLHSSQGAGTSGQPRDESTVSGQSRDGLITMIGGQNNIQEHSFLDSAGNTQNPPIQEVNQTLPSEGTNPDIGNFLQQLISNSGGIPAPGRGRDSSQGMGIPGGVLGNLMGQVMQNPFMRNVVQQVVEQVGEESIDHDGGFPSNLDFSGLMQQMMPVVGQALSRVNSSATNNPEQGSSVLQDASARIREGALRSSAEGLREGPNISALFQQIMPVVAQAFGGNRPVGDSDNPSNLHPAMNFNIDNVHQARTAASQLDTHQTSTSVQTPENGPNTKRQKINVEKAAEKLEQGTSADEVFRVVAETANMSIASDDGHDENSSLLVESLCQNDGLIEDYVALLLKDLSFGNHVDQ